MLRYNNQVGFSKPVDYFRPLSVDVSVEYELPKEVAPPPGSAPLLIIHPSAYYRTKSNAANPQGVLSPRGKQPSAAELSASTSSSSSSYFLRSSTHSSSHLNNLPTIHQSSVYSSTSSNPTAGGSSGNKSSTRYSSASVIVANPRTRSSNVVGATDSRPHRPSNCPYGKCDECSSGSGSKPSSGSSKKLSVLQQQQQQSQDPFASLYNSLLLDRQNASLAAAATVTSNTAALSRSQLQQLHQQQQQQSQMLHRSVGTSITPTSSSISTSRSTSSNKRLRMSSQQQQQQHLIEMMSPAAMDLPLATDWYPRGTSSLIAPTITSSSTPSSNRVMNMSPESIYLNQRSALYKQHGSNGGSQGQSLLSGNGSSNSSGSVGGNTNPVMVSNYMLNSGGGSVSGIMSNGNSSATNVRRGHPTLNALSSLYSSTTAASQSAQRFFKECPIPVEKGSGSDSGVCSENDSDISPPMAPYFNANSNNHPPATRARSILNQDLPSAGCYCCCCPSTSDNTTPSSTSRKSSSSSGGKAKGKSSRSSSSSIIGSSGSGGGGNHGNSSSGVSNYSGYMAGILQESQLGSMLISSADSPVTSARNSPMAMDSSPAPLRKWFLGPPIENQTNFGRWFQV